MNSNVLVSVIIPHYNVGAYVLEAIASALAQTWENIEIVIVDDGSDEEHRRVLESLKDERIRVVFNDHQGVSAARNTAVGHAAGKYILSLDADDKLGPSFAEKAVKLLEEDGNLGMVMSRRRYFGARNDEPRHRDMTPENVLLGRAHAGGFGMFRKSDWALAGGYDPMLPVHQDWGFCLQLMELGRKIHRIEEVLYNYREHPASLMSEFNRSGGGAVHFKKFDPRLYLFKKHRDLYLSYPEFLVERIFGKPEKPGNMESRRRKYRLILLLDRIPLLRRLFSRKIAKAKDRLEYFSLFDDVKK